MENENMIEEVSGTVHQIPEFNDKVVELQKKWSEQNVPNKKANLSKLTLFFLGSVDILICTIDNLLDKGIDKKATVLMGMDEIYTYVQKSPYIPIWLKPFLNVIKNYVVYTVFSMFIDWAVSKYRQGYWRIKDDSNEPQEKSMTKKATMVTKKKAKVIKKKSNRKKK